jgi:uncharacterized protein YprB with RNaseH-like and TPR domain
VRTYVGGPNLREFVRDIRPYRLLITHNRNSFDLRVLRDCIGCRLDQKHIDLRQLLGTLRFRGGLKPCDRRLGMMRPRMVHINGYVAFLLWRKY